MPQPHNWQPLLLGDGKPHPQARQEQCTTCHVCRTWANPNDEEEEPQYWYLPKHPGDAGTRPTFDEPNCND